MISRNCAGAGGFETLSRRRHADGRRAAADFEAIGETPPLELQKRMAG